MKDLSVSNISSWPLGRGDVKKTRVQDPLSDFKSILLNSVDEVNKLLDQADQSAKGMVSGNQDIHQTMIAVEQANLSLRLMVQVRNKMVAAYEEIMRMQI
jgi:flagellar hook-basal body complex protein FliE